jgi:hypothetical protein
MFNIVNELLICDEAIEVITNRLLEQRLILEFDLKTINLFNFIKKNRRINKNLQETTTLLNDLKKVNGENTAYLRILNDILDDAEMTATRELTKEEQYIHSEFACEYERKAKDFYENDLLDFDFEEE